MRSVSRAKSPGLSNNVANTKQKLKALLSKGSLSTSTQIWKSRISWRIAIAAFLTILAVQAAVLNITLKEFESDRLIELENIGKSSITPLIEPVTGQFLSSPFSDKTVNRLLSKTKVNGLTVYGLENIMHPGELKLEFIKNYGESTVTTLNNPENTSKTYRSFDGNSYEFVFKVVSVDATYFIVTRMDSSSVQGELFNYVKQTIMVMLYLSGFVTVVLMIALGHWLLEPILFMRNNLIIASQNPEEPNVKPSPFNPNDEIGSAIDIAQKLILQNADNLTRIKSAAEDKIHKLAYYDTLTTLPNRTLFLQELAERMRKSGEEKTQRIAVITIDLDHFKDINDSMGHNVGDAILRGVGKRLRASMPEAAMVSRTGEDEFAITMPLSTNINNTRDIADRVIDVIRNEPFKIFNEQFQVRASIGIATFPEDGTDPDQVLKNADIALNRAKEEGRDSVREYSEDFDRAVQVRFQMLRDLRDALEQGQLDLHYQPQLNLKTGEVIGAEALLRWWKPDNSKEGGKFISPGEFIPVAEQSGLIVPIGEWVMEKACKDAVEWKNKHGYTGRIAVNVSGNQFSQSDIVSFTQHVIKSTGIEPHKLELEVTESVFMDDIKHTVQILKDLHALGVELAIDDFGTGYSSLSYLRQFPIDRLKIDQSFIRNALNNPDDAAIAKTIVSLGHSLNLKVIAEGVETKDHEIFLIEEGCDEVQGFRYSKPVPADKFIEFNSGYSGDLDSFNS